MIGSGAAAAANDLRSGFDQIDDFGGHEFRGLFEDGLFPIQDGQTGIGIDEDTDSPLHQPDECFQQEVGESLCRTCLVVCLLQFRQNPQRNLRDARHGSWTHRSHMDIEGITE